MMIMLCKLTLAVSLLLAVSGSALAETKLLFSTFFPQSHPVYADVFVPWAEDVKKETEGRVVIEFAPSSLAPPPGQLDMVENGVADIGAQFTGVVPKRLAPLMITEVPGPASTAETMSVALWRTYQEYFAQSADLKRLKVLSLFVFPNQGFFNVRDNSVDTIDELRHAKIATTPGNAAAAYGAVTSGVIAGPAFRYFELVSKGMVDAYATVTLLDIPSFNLQNYTKSGYNMGDLSTAGSFVLVMNSNTWRKLSPQDQEVLERLSGEAFAHRMSKLDDRVDAIGKKLEGSGIKMTPLPADMAKGMKEAFSFLEEEWIDNVKDADVDGAAAIKAYRGYLAEPSAK